MASFKDSSGKVYTSNFLLSNEDIAKLGIPEHERESYRRKHYQDSFAVETWYQTIEQYTFKTQFLDLEYDEAKAMVCAYKDHLQCFSEKYMTAEHEQTLNKLQEKLDAALKLHFPNGAFLKLNTRSPKDTPWREDKDTYYRSLVDAEMNKLPNKQPQHVQIAFLKAMNRCMRVRNGKEAMQLLLRSQRVEEDLQKQLAFSKELFCQKFILREWIDEVVEYPQGEYRCFVHHHELNAVTQYFADSYFDDLASEEARNAVSNQIKSFYNEHVKGKLKHEHFVIDFWAGPNNKTYIIELNPFHIGAGSGLFSWSQHRDLFMHGPYTIRFNDEKPTEEIYKQCMTIQWEKYLVLNHNVEISWHKNLKPATTTTTTNAPTTSSWSIFNLFK